MSNKLINEKSPYLLQHKDNPVDWYPWSDEAFERAVKEEKPVFLSIGYSSCHWCHVFAHESFEDSETAEILNKYFISVKVDREERPDIDSVYMSVCQAFTGSGGWPTSVFMTPDKKPFFAGTYFPKKSQGRMIGFKELLLSIQNKWENDRDFLLKQSDDIVEYLKKDSISFQNADKSLIEDAAKQFSKLYDKKHGGFGNSPKFPTPHNIIFLLSYYERNKNPHCLYMAEHTLIQMFRGGIFDHIGYGFCRYSTDEKFLVPHFEKMLYDNALLIMAYCKVYAVTKKQIYLEIAEKTAEYIIREMTSSEGGFFSSQDADSEGEEGKYYLFSPEEIIELLGKEEGELFNRHFDISDSRNFEGKSIPNLLRVNCREFLFEDSLQKLRNYRKNRYSLHLDDKIITLWNCLMIAALSELYLHTNNIKYLDAAKKADKFINENLRENDLLFVSYRDGKRGLSGLIDDYAAYIFAKLYLYRATLDFSYIDLAKHFCEKAVIDFADASGGFYLYGKQAEQLILRPKETYDGAIPSGNSMMAYNLVHLHLITSDEKFSVLAKKQLDFIASASFEYPAGHSMFLISMLEYYEPPMKITVVSDTKTASNQLLYTLPKEAVIIFLAEPTEEYPLKNGKTTYYVCKNHSCLPPVNDIGILNE